MKRFQTSLDLIQSINDEKDKIRKCIMKNKIGRADLQMDGPPPTLLHLISKTCNKLWELHSPLGHRNWIFVEDSILKPGSDREDMSLCHRHIGLHWASIQKRRRYCNFDPVSFVRNDFLSFPRTYRHIPEDSIFWFLNKLGKVDQSTGWNHDQTRHG